MRNVIIIDTTNQCILQDTLPSENVLEYLQSKIGGYITVVGIENGNDLIVDDEGLLKSPEKFFIFKDVGQEVYAGNGIVAGVTKDGETIGTTMTLEEVRSKVVFVDKFVAALYAKVVNS